MLALLLVTTPGHAKKKKQSEDINFGVYTCQEFLEEAAQGKAEDIGIVLMWIDGYLSGVSGDTVWKQQGFEEFSERLVNYCIKNGDANLLDAARKKGIQ
ncbi:MAG: hypothetical protein HQL99_17330, partial [Magnetococcales bacterium]|nr:hypothetical protein [Magnetococcales bacterium]